MFKYKAEHTLLLWSGQFFSCPFLGVRSWIEVQLLMRLLVARTKVKGQHSHNPALGYCTFKTEKKSIENSSLEGEYSDCHCQYHPTSDW